MSATEASAGRADDGFERHYTEKIWSLIPQVYRDEDDRAATPGRLRALVELLAEQAAVARRSIDRLWADTRIDEADDWAVPYLGALVGARPVSARNRAGRRANVARTILYRRRQGTARLPELLADDIADWDAVASEAFRRLLRTWHLLDPGPVAGPVTGSPQWGYPDLRSVRLADALDGPFDDLSHRVDVRRHRGMLGRYHIPKVNLHVFRQFAFPLPGVTPVRIADGLYTLDPSGRDVPLFQVGGRVPADCVAAHEWQVRAPISCRRLNSAGFRPQRGHAPVGLEDALAPIYGRRFSGEAGLLEAAEAALAADPAVPDTLADHEAAHLVDRAMEPSSPRRNLLPGGDPAALSVALAIGDDPADPPLGPQHCYGADLAQWGVDHAPPGWAEALVDPLRGRVRLTKPLAADRDLYVQRLFTGVFWPVGAGTHDRAGQLAASGFIAVTDQQPDLTAPLSGELRFLDNRTYRPVVSGGVIDVDGDLTLSAADQARPYVVLPATGAGATLRIRAVGAPGVLVIDGLWIGLEREAGTGEARLQIDGAWRKVILRDVTIDPGGERAAAPGESPAEIPPVQLRLGGAIDELVVERCVTGRIEERISAVDPCSTDTAVIVDSIVGGAGAGAAIRMRNAHLRLDRCTVFGDLVAGQLDASHVLVDGLVRVEDRQSGCFRFGAAAAGGSVPRPYESHFFDGGLPAATFVSRRFGAPGYAQLGPLAPPRVRTGGEDGTEIGAFHRALDPVKRADLETKLDETTPVNVVPQLVIET